MSKPVIIDIGPGPNPKPDATVCVDLYEWPTVKAETVIHNIRHFPYPFATDHADKIYLCDVIEHVTVFDAPKVLREINRILKPGGVFDISCPDVLWIMERIVKDDWFEQTKGAEWLRSSSNSWDNAMDYLFGGWRHPIEYKIPGMGHVNGFNEEILKRLLADSGFKDIRRVPDTSNPEPANASVLKILATK